MHLSRKAFDVLCLLLSRRPTVVAKEDLFKAVWPDTFVTDANLNVVIGEIRRALGDSAHAPQFIRTAHGVGYAFCSEAADDDAAAHAPVPSTPSRAWLVAGERTFQLSPGENVIGRDMQCHVWLDDAGVSRRHASLRLTASGAVLRDLQSTNGTFVDQGQINGEVTLADGDRIGIGEVELEFREAANEPPATKRISRKGR